MYCMLRTIFQKTETGPSYLRGSLTSNKSGQVVWSSFDENKKRINSESLLWWNNKRLYFDQGTESIVLIAIFV